MTIGRRTSRATKFVYIAPCLKAWVNNQEMENPLLETTHENPNSRTGSAGGSFEPTPRWIVARLLGARIAQ